MSRNIFIFISLLLVLIGCHKTKPNYLSPVEAFTYVNPFIGTGGHGHTYPGATMPFGMMQLSPDTRLDGWDGCSGYHYSDNYIYGFSHTHLSGTGVSDYGDILLMPTDKVEFYNGSDGKDGYRAHFSHDNEYAEPGYYTVFLDSTDIKVELTVSERSGMHRYEFKEGKPQVVMIDLVHRDEVLDSKLDQISSNEFSGFRHSKAWATDQRLFFNMEFSKAISNVQYLDDKTEGKAVKAAFSFDPSEGTTLEIRIGISAVDEAGAKLNRETELGKSSFDDIREKARQAWLDQLGKIQIAGGTETERFNFYTSLYHTMLAPNIYQDVDGRYRGMNLEIYQSDEFDYYTAFSLWDTYRATHPLYTIIEQERTNDFIRTLLSKYEEGGIMPIWDLSGCYTGCMIGYHGVPVIADAYLKGIRDYDANLALEAMKHSANQDHLGLESYKKYGFIPVEEESESVSKTLEYAYDDWCIAMMAKEMGKENDYIKFIKRAQNYKNLFDPTSKFMRGRFNNSWFSPFDPYEVNFNYTEANAWQYRFYVPQDISGMMDLLGGPKALENELDSLFSAEIKTSGRNQADITGLIGQYAHGNEPSHHMAYLYNFTGKPHKTMERVKEIRDKLYFNAPDGISGNEDCGQMSAWYVFSAMGFYPVTPGSNEYIIGTPMFDGLKINLENKNSFEILAHDLSDGNFYIESTRLNGEKLDGSYITHQDIVEGGRFDFYMNDNPAIWMSRNGNEPKSGIDEHLITPAPFIKEGELAFKEKTQVVLGCSDHEAQIFMRVGDGSFKLHNAGITINTSGVLEYYAEGRNGRSVVVKTEFREIDPNVTITLETQYANQYNAGGDNALIDGVLGTRDFRTGTWQGYQDEDVIATIDLGEEKSINMVFMNFLQDQRSWIFLPTEVSCYGSIDGVTFVPIDVPKSLNSISPSEEIKIQNVYFKQPNTNYRYIKVVAKKTGGSPRLASWSKI